MRVIGGSLRGRDLGRVPDGVRPTSDRVRESLFSMLGPLDGMQVLDLYAGTGALGLEAHSRGADRVVFCERSRKVVRALEARLRALGLEQGEALRVLPLDARRALRRLQADAELHFDCVFFDPPYAATDRVETLEMLFASPILSADPTVVVEVPTRETWSPVHGARVVDQRRYGDTMLVWLGRSGSQEESRGMSAGDPKRRIALFPASFDPITNGHLDLIERSRTIFDEIVLAVAKNVSKNAVFSSSERIALLEAVSADMQDVSVQTFDGLVVEYAEQIGASAIIRGLRAMSDFEYEFEMALMNKHLSPRVEVVFFMTSQEYLYVSSSRLKELVRFGASVDEFVPPIVAEALKQKLAGQP